MSVTLPVGTVSGLSSSWPAGGAVPAQRKKTHPGSAVASTRADSPGSSRYVPVAGSVEPLPRGAWTSSVHLLETVTVTVAVSEPPSPSLTV